VGIGRVARLARRVHRQGAVPVAGVQQQLDRGAMLDPEIAAAASLLKAEKWDEVTTKCDETISNTQVMFTWISNKTPFHLVSHNRFLLTKYMLL
jgi:hypothetical protein